MNLYSSQLDGIRESQAESTGKERHVRTESNGEALDKHRIPVIDRMMEVLGLLERRPNGATIRELVEVLHQPRTTVYRILNTLQAHGMVRRSVAGSYALGPRLLALAARAVGDGQDYDLAALAQPHLERLSEATGEGSKVSVLDGDAILVVAAVQGVRDYALTVVPGQRLPLHAGAAGKVLLAHLPKSELAALLEKPLAGYTVRTFTDPKRLAAELARIRRQGWAQDKGEYAPSIRAFAAPIPDRTGRVVAALSVPYLAGADTGRTEKIRASVIATAGAIAADLPAPRPRPPMPAVQSKKAASSAER
jgi:DNA-binding IclR family transcriptional regulator